MIRARCQWNLKNDERATSGGRGFATKCGANAGEGVCNLSVAEQRPNSAPEVLNIRELSTKEARRTPFWVVRSVGSHLLKKGWRERRV
jgi:hypothetical protein